MSRISSAVQPLASAPLTWARRSLARPIAAVIAIAATGHTVGVFIISGWRGVAGWAPSVAGIMGVVPGTPGAGAFTVTAVPARSLAQPTDAASSAAFDGP